MPYTRIVIDRLPSLDSRQEGVHHHQLFHFGWKLGGIRISHHKADVVSDHPGSGDAELAGKAMNADGRCFHVRTVFRDIRVPDARQIRSDHSKPLGQQRHDRPPHAGRLRVAMQKDHMRPMAGHQIVHLKTVHVRHKRNDPLIGLWRRQNGSRQYRRAKDQT